MYPICVDTLKTFLQANYDRWTDGRTKKATYRGKAIALPKKDYRAAQKFVQHLKEKLYKQLITNSADSFDNI